MMTVKELSDLTGISVRTLHYYDEIGLFVPTQKSEAGYRLYDEKSLEVLQQILFFREFDIPLREIKAIMEDFTLDRNQVLQMQRTMLMTRKERIERLIASIDDILKGDGTMEFEVFTKREIEDLYEAMAANMTEEQKQLFIGQYGSMEEWRKSFLETASSAAAQKNFETVAEWYGSKEKALEASMNPGNAELQIDCQKQLERVLQKLAESMEQDICSDEIQSLAAEYDSVTRQMFQIPDATKMGLELAQLYQNNKEIQAAQDSIYGEGATEFTGRVLEAYYGKIISAPAR